MPPPRKTSFIQVTVLISYLERYKSIQLGTSILKTKNALKRESDHWLRLTGILNRCPGLPKSPTKWKAFWSNMKAVVRKKAASGKVLMPHEIRVLQLTGHYINEDEGPSVLKYDENDPEPTTVEKNSDGVYHSGLRYSESPRPSHLHKMTMAGDMPTYAFRDRMPVDVVVKGFGSDEDARQDVDVPDWVRTVEHSRLNLEARTTEALEKMSQGITTMATAMKTMFGSLKMIEAAVRSNNNH